MSTNVCALCGAEVQQRNVKKHNEWHVAERQQIAEFLSAQRDDLQKILNNMGEQVTQSLKGILAKIERTENP